MNIYKRYRFPSEIIQHTVWLYHRFNLSHRDIEDLLAERGIAVSYEAIRLWCNKFGSEYAKRLKRKRRGFGDTFFIGTPGWPPTAISLARVAIPGSPSRCVQTKSGSCCAASWTAPIWRQTSASPGWRADCKTLMN